MLNCLVKSNVPLICSKPNSECCFFSKDHTGWPQTLENRENGQKKIPCGKNQGICKREENQGTIREFEKNKLTLLNNIKI